jgi:hypothetical protein
MINVLSPVGLTIFLVYIVTRTTHKYLSVDAGTWVSDTLLPLPLPDSQLLTLYFAAVLVQQRQPSGPRAYPALEDSITSDIKLA